MRLLIYKILSLKGKRKLFNFKSMIEDSKLKLERTLPEFFDYMLETSGYLAVLISEDQAEVNR